MRLTIRYIKINTVSAAASVNIGTTMNISPRDRSHEHEEKGVGKSPEMEEPVRAEEPVRGEGEIRFVH